MSCLAVLQLFRSSLENAPHQNDGKCYKVNDCFHFGNSRVLPQFPFVKNILQMLADGWHPDAEQLRHRLLSAPQGLVIFSKFTTLLCEKSFERAYGGKGERHPDAFAFLLDSDLQAVYFDGKFRIVLYFAVISLFHRTI